MLSLDSLDAPLSAGIAKRAAVRRREITWFGAENLLFTSADAKSTVSGTLPASWSTLVNFREL